MNEFTCQCTAVLIEDTENEQKETLEMFIRTCVRLTFSINYLLTESDVVTRKSQTESCNSEVSTERRKTERSVNKLIQKRIT